MREQSRTLILNGSFFTNPRQGSIELSGAKKRTERFKTQQINQELHSSRSCSSQECQVPTTQIREPCQGIKNRQESVTTIEHQKCWHTQATSHAYVPQSFLVAKFTQSACQRADYSSGVSSRLFAETSPIVETVTKLSTVQIDRIHM